MSVEAERPAGWADFQYDHHSSRVSAAPHDLWRRLREQCPVIHSDRYGGFWLVTGYDDVKTVLSDTATFTATEGINLPRMNIPSLPGESDPPVHTHYRSLLNPLLAPQVIKQHEGWIRDLAREWVANVRGKEQFDACADFCEPFAKRVSLRVIGYPLEDLDRIDHWTEVLVTGLRGDEEGVRVSREFFGYLADSLSRRAESPPQDDLLSAIASGRIDGEPLDSQVKQSLLLQITLGGLHTTGAVLAGALVWLAGHPEDRTRLRHEPDLFRSATEEFIRYVTPVPHSTRTTVREVELTGCPIAAHETVMFNLGSANYDRTIFEDPDDVVLDRFPNRHLGFGAGPHRCVGSHLAKLTVRIGLEEFLAEIGDFEVADYYALRWSHGEGRALTTAPLLIRGT
jgi:cytochrome P450